MRQLNLRAFTRFNTLSRIRALVASLAVVTVVATSVHFVGAVRAQEGTYTQADIRVSGTHTVVSITDNGDGSWSVTLALTLSNDGTVGINDLALSGLLPPFRMIGDGTDAVLTASLAPGQTTAVQWTGDAMQPVDTTADLSVVVLGGTGTDSGGEALAFALTSELETAQ